MSDERFVPGSGERLERRLPGRERSVPSGVGITDARGVATSWLPTGDAGGEMRFQISADTLGAIFFLPDGVSTSDVSEDGDIGSGRPLTLTMGVVSLSGEALVPTKGE